MNNKIIDRIQKLLALSSSPNAEEAASAAAMAAKLMAQYEIEEADLRVKTGAENEDPIEDSNLVGIDPKSKRVAKWKGILVSGLTKAFHCYGWWDARGDRWGTSIFRIIGRQSAVRTVNYLFKYLVNELEALAEREWNSYCAFNTVDVHGKRWKTSFLLGAAVTIYSRLIDQSKAAAPQTASEQALILIKQDREAVTKYYNNVKPKLHATASTSTSVNNKAYNAGKEAGANVNLSGGKAIGKTPLMLSA